MEQKKYFLSMISSQNQLMAQDTMTNMDYLVQIKQRKKE